MKKTSEILTWVFFVSQGIKDNIDLMRCMLLCNEIMFQGEKATVESIKQSSGYKSCLYDIPNSLLTDAKIQEMIDWK